ncbi:hypothetical protein BCR33DRAFT_715609 [Rhizoclosmatium globosum]|uniref:Uncharacterized protein n=1 Tax=Rhizoclosmatium globosum TaxID=329046 RepID=A0A1Y2CIB3_9FUNG|nr:hypothetical protein BCR33DRAFT_715609 [Rhizoclosmatium globosum]|eukprot:ORY46564.1 hypothetical protein BCR33DRAFT_715609 [Rhizoclosmatium globosum]
MQALSRHEVLLHLPHLSLSDTLTLRQSSRSLNDASRQLLRTAIQRMNPNNQTTNFIFFKSTLSPLKPFRRIKLEVTRLPTTHSLKETASYRITPSCCATYTIPLQSAFARISEAVAAKRGDCARVQVLGTSSFSTTASNVGPSPSEITTLHDGTAISLPHLVYNHYFGTDTPSHRRVLSHPIGSSQVLSKFLKSSTVYLQLLFRGGGEYFLEERYECDGDGTVLYQVCNSPRVDAIDVSVSRTALSLPDSLSLTLTKSSGWITELWDRIEQDPLDLKGLHEDMTERKFNHRK